MLEQKSGQIRLNRRNLLQIFAVAGVVGVTRLLPVDLFKSGFHMVRKSLPMMGTILNLIVYSRNRDQAETAVAATLTTMRGIEAKLSRHDPASEVSQLNRTGGLDNPGQELLDVLQLAESVSQISSGGFDVTILPLLALYQKEQGGDQSLINQTIRSVGYVDILIKNNTIRFNRPGMSITLDGIAKGYIVDRGVDTLTDHGFGQVYVEAGGDLMVRGPKPNGEPWRIGVQNPRPGMSRELVVIETDSLAVATSGDYYQAFTPDMRLHHIINPRTGYSSPELASCTVTAPSAALADALATACMVFNAKDAIELLEEIPGCQGYVVTKNLLTRKTSGFSG
ncbi:MAG: FAD:protein FMN transferase [Desulfobulbaceae bacterium]|nr:FAD:protein FMN transferase [Desulfobulbaceae bacterium]